GYMDVRQHSTESTPLAVPHKRPPELFFFSTDTATPEIYTLSLHDALPISRPPRGAGRVHLPHPRARSRTPYRPARSLWAPGRGSSDVRWTRNRPTSWRC